MQNKTFDPDMVAIHRSLVSVMSGADTKQCEEGL
jgi:hypothetical protein